MRRAFVFGVSAIAALSAPMSSARAATSARFEAHASFESITLDQTIELTVSLVRDGTQALESYRPPTVPDFEVLHNSTSQQIETSIMNGRQAVRMVEEHVYVLRARKKGTLTIGPAVARVGGQEIKTKPITIAVAPPSKNAMSPVLPGQSPAPNAATNAPPSAPPDGMRGSDELFVDARADKTKIYVGEQVLAQWRLFTQSDVLNYRPVTEPKHDDFWSESLFTPGKFLAKDRQVVNGREYAVALLFKRALFPLKTGKLMVTPLEAEITTLETAFAPTGSGLRRSSPITLEVRPLPVDGRPLAFEPANVGQFSLTATVDRKKVKAGEAVTWTVVVSGAGNIRNIKLPPQTSLDGWKVYDPTVKETIEPGDIVRGEKRYVYLLMPQRGGELALPAAEFAYFDPEKGAYQVAKSETFTITVEGDPSAAGTVVAAPAEENLLAQQIRPIRSRQSVRSDWGAKLWRGTLAIVLLATPPGLWIVVLVIDAIRRRLSQETPRARRRRARRSARRRMRVAEYHIKGQRPSAFFGECARVIYEHLEYALGQKVEALTLTELRGFLEGRGFPKETAEMVVRELETCDFARFAPSASGPGEMRAALRRVKTLLEWIEKVRAVDEREAA